MVEKEPSFQAEVEAHILSEYPQIENLLMYPDQIEIINLQPYWAEQNELNEWKPNGEGKLAIRALILLLENIEQKNHQNPRTEKRVLPRIVIAGGHRGDFGGLTMSQIYTDALKDAINASKLQKKDILIIAEHEQKKDYNDLAEDTRGTLMFLKKIRQKEGFKKALSIGRRDHLERIALLSKRNGIPTTEVSIEALITYFKPKFMELLKSESSTATRLRIGILESQKNFAMVEERNLMIMALDHQGKLMELLARFLSKRKRQFMHREAQ